MKYKEFTDQRQIGASLETVMSIKLIETVLNLFKYKDATSLARSRRPAPR